MLGAVKRVLVARPPASNFDVLPTQAERAEHRAQQRDAAIEVVARYNPDAVVCVGVPFGHTRPQWIVPHGGEVTLDGAATASLGRLPLSRSAETERMSRASGFDAVNCVADARFESQNSQPISSERKIAAS